MDLVVDLMQPKVTSDMNDTLLRPYTSEEVKTALFHMQPMKALGLDGMPRFFEKILAYSE